MALFHIYVVPPIVASLQSSPKTHSSKRIGLKISNLHSRTFQQLRIFSSTCRARLFHTLSSFLSNSSRPLRLTWSRLQLVIGNKDTKQSSLLTRFIASRADASRYSTVIKNGTDIALRVIHFFFFFHFNSISFSSSSPHFLHVCHPSFH